MIIHFDGEKYLDKLDLAQRNKEISDNPRIFIPENREAFVFLDEEGDVDELMLKMEKLKQAMNGR